MFRMTDIRRTASLLTITALVAASPAVAQTLSEHIEVEKAYNEETGNYEMRRTNSGEKGTITTSRICGEGDNGLNRDGCVQVKTVTTADGTTARKGEVVIQGPVRTRAVGAVTTPDGTERRFLRRWRN